MQVNKRILILCEDEKSSLFFEDLKDKMLTAIKNAEKLNKSLAPELNSGTKIYDLTYYTTVHELVKVLLGE